MNRTDESRQVRPGLGRVSRPGRDDDEDEDDVETAQEGLGARDEADGDEEGDMKNTSATQGERDGSGYPGQAAEERSEASQKSGIMGQAGKRGGSEGKIQGQEISDSDELKGPAFKVIHGRDKPEGHAAEIEGAHQGSGRGGEPRSFTNLGHGEREATISGAYQGQHGSASLAGEGFEAGGRLSKERARGPTGTKR